MGKLFASTIKIKKLKEFEIDLMYNLFASYYDNTQKEKFLKDLLSKDKVILLRDHRDKEIKGFSTLNYMTMRIAGKKVKGVFSGDTVIDESYWGQTALSVEFFNNLLKLKAKNPLTDCYWFLISKGYKTYLLLTNNFENYYPRFDKETPHDKKEIIDSFSQELFGELYDKEKGILKFAGMYDRLKTATAPIKGELLENPNIKYFNESNPKWQDGDELCCIGRVDVGLITKFISRTTKKKILRKKK